MKGHKIEEAVVVCNDRDVWRSILSAYPCGDPARRYRYIDRMMHADL